MALHHGMIVVGMPPSFKGSMGVEEVKGGSFYGSTTIKDDGSRNPSKIELEGAKV
mgnify:CR=1 FL=1